ncbi:MAG: acyl phosphate:glycerol-3-phosphate acyltransferase [Chloroflexota bacterium]|nr:acyl phosphate:glycerol-3-phosphate acyltransferase [Chloroflexota bacterium]
MTMMNALLSLPIAYLIGSIPSGWLVVKLFTGQDVRSIESGRTGGTNAMRAGGPVAGLLTAVLDAAKGAAAVWISQALSAGIDWTAAMSGVLAIVGHNYSAFLVEKGSDGKLHFRGGAGGATTLGAAIGLWLHSWMIILPFALVFYVVVGYASLTTISIAFSAMGLFTIRALQGMNPWAYALFGVAALAIVMYALRPNLIRLKEGTERQVQLLARIFTKKFKSKDKEE